MNGIDVAITVAGILFVAFAIAYMAWERWDTQRRSERLVHINLGRATGWRA